MKGKIIFTLLAISTGIFAAAQKFPIVKVYAYSQVVLPGARKTNAIDENGNVITRPTIKKVNYYFYAELKKRKTIKVVAIWLQGKKYNARINIVSKTPVEIATGDAFSQSKKIILSPASGNLFLLITPGEAVVPELKTSGALQKMINNSELVVVYQWKGKLKYFTVKKINEIEPLATV